MSTNSSPRGPQKKALLIAIPGEIDGSASETGTGVRDKLENWAARGCCTGSRGTDGVLKNPYKDVERMKDCLIRCGYKDGDITVMRSRENSQSPLWPGQENILKCIYELTENAQTGDHLFFHYAGHGMREICPDRTEEEDKKDEYMITEDGIIRDNDLKKHLIGTLRSGVTLTAVMDSCHSGTILDLPHWHCNETENTLSVVTEDGVAGKLNKYWKTTCDNGKLCELRASQPDDGPTIICISSAKDHQRAWETEGNSMSQILIAILEEDPKPKLEDLLVSLRRGVKDLYEDVWDKHKQYARDNGEEPTTIANFVQETMISSRVPFLLNTREGVWDP
ncbi:caspase domain-containing protein [Cyathus striatus]|nr:caspase domain-containing protein [Cyathus striatus]KAF8989567.1 caspase domain-containing protein [Cyathus striatus]